MEHYLDNSATTRVCPEAAQAALRAMTEVYGNPSSTHTKGREAKQLLDASRKLVASAMGCAPSELIFTSCGSESDNWALLSGAEAMRRRGNHIITSAVEHDAIRKSAEELERRGYDVTYLKPDSTGSIPVDAVKNALRPDTILVSLMLVNNETGAINDISSVSKLLKSSGSPALLHTDAVQAFMKIPFTPKSLGADMISVSGHKIHAPKGIGALYVRSGLRLKPYIMGGSQEDGRRAGTEAMPQIAAFGEACRIAKENLAENAAKMAALRQLTIDTLTPAIPELQVINGAAPHILGAMLPVAVCGDNAGRIRTVLQHIAESGLQRGALTAVDLVPQHRNMFVFLRKEPKRIFTAAVIDQHKVGKPCGKQRCNRFLQFLVRIERRQNHRHMCKIR